MHLGTRTVEREFRLELDLDWMDKLKPAARWAKEVVEGIENDELLVFPSDEALHLEAIQDDHIVDLNVGATKPVSIREWLCVGCQTIRWGMPEAFREKEQCVAFYKSNGSEVLWPPYQLDRPIGPIGFSAEIALGPTVQATVTSNDSASVEHWFKCIVAHELVHTFDYMRLLVPAFDDWDSFWAKALRGGSLNDQVMSALSHTSLFVDSYGEENELECLRGYWPSHADEWFQAFRESTYEE